jgi:alpha-beta hydrolase superfamily lysophospholipase
VAHVEGNLAGGRLYYQSWQAAVPAVADVVIAHGYAEHSGRYAHVAAALNRAGCTVWAIDHRGHGRSSGDRGDIESWEAVVADLDLLVDVAATDGRPLFLVGHSMGGAIAVAYAQTHQHRLTGLSLSAPSVVVAPELAAVAEMDEIPVLPLAPAVSTDPAVVKAYEEDPLNYHGAPPRTTLQLIANGDKLVAGLGELTLPVQIMQGSADMLVPAAAFRMIVNGVGSTDVHARLWPGLFHEIFNEPIQDQVIGELVRWITERV